VSFHREIKTRLFSYDFTSLRELVSTEKLKPDFFQHFVEEVG